MRRTLLLLGSATYKFPSFEILRPVGPAKDAAVPNPSVFPGRPFPANIECCPLCEIFRITFLSVSETKMVPLKSTSIPLMRPNCLAASLLMLVTDPDWRIFRTLLLPSSVTYTVLSWSIAMEEGPAKRAAEPIPSVDAANPAAPARVVTAPVGVTLRMVWFPPSVTNALFSASSASLPGL